MILMSLALKLVPYTSNMVMSVKTIIFGLGDVYPIFLPLDFVSRISKWQKWNHHENLHHFYSIDPGQKSYVSSIWEGSPPVRLSGRGPPCPTANSSKYHNPRRPPLKTWSYCGHRAGDTKQSGKIGHTMVLRQKVNILWRHHIDFHRGEYMENPEHQARCLKTDHVLSGGLRGLWYFDDFAVGQGGPSPDRRTGGTLPR